MPEEPTTGPAYRALALQLRCRSVAGEADGEVVDAVRARAIDAVGRLVAGSLAFIGTDCRLVVLPEYFLTGHPVGDPIARWADLAAIDPTGPEYQALAEIARRHGIHLSGNAYERDRHFPGLYFQCSFVIDPAGDVVLRYRRLNSMFAPTPHDVWTAYLEHYGIDGVFPVAPTAIGRLAAVASEEILFPELTRCLAMRGAEVLLHSTSEASSPAMTDKDVARRARARENLMYVVSANSAGIEGSPIPAESTDGGSQIVDFEGRVVVTAGPGESMVANAELDLTALRRARRRPGMANLLARNRFDLYATSYAEASFHEADGLAGGAPPDRAHFLDAQRRVIERIQDAGLI